MNGAPRGFIPLDNNVIVGVRQIASVRQEIVQEVDPEWKARYDQECREYRIRVGNSPYVPQPIYMPDMRPTGELRVHIKVASGMSEYVFSRCSLIQFMARMTEALEEDVRAAK